MKKILMVCLGNICRSPLAEGILRKKLAEKGKQGVVDSVGFEPYHIGEHPDNRTVSIAKKYGIDISSHIARLFSVDDFDRFDKIYVMDQNNYKDVIFVARNKEDKDKVDFIMNEVSSLKNQIIPDPYYGDLKDFELTYRLLDQACEKIANNL